MAEGNESSTVVLCQCGCGQPAPVIIRTLPYVRGHRWKQGRVGAPAAPSLCLCGCGQFTDLATRSNRRDRIVRGLPLRFIKGHYRRRPRSSAATTNRETFMSRVAIDDGDEGCWLWTGYINSEGYGRTGGRTTHRLSWQLFRGPIPNGLSILHRCDVRRCVNPGHLRPGTNSDNTADMMRRRRFAHKLTEQQVRAIRSHRGTQKEIAVEFGISNGHVSDIINRSIWKELDGLNANTSLDR